MVIHKLLQNVIWHNKHKVAYLETPLIGVQQTFKETITLKDCSEDKQFIICWAPWVGS